MDELRNVLHIIRIKYVLINVVDAEWARKHVDANVLVLAAEFTKGRQAEKIVETFFKTKFLGLNRYKRRIKKMDR